MTYHTDISPDPVTALVLQDAVVLAAGHQSEPDPTGKTSDVTVVTLLLTPEQAERAVLASIQGAIHFDLRNGADSSRSGDAPMLTRPYARCPTRHPPLGYCCYHACADSSETRGDRNRSWRGRTMKLRSDHPGRP